MSLAYFSPCSAFSYDAESFHFIFKYLTYSLSMYFSLFSISLFFLSRYLSIVRTITLSSNTTSTHLCILLLFSAEKTGCYFVSLHTLWLSSTSHLLLEAIPFFYITLRSICNSPTGSFVSLTSACFTSFKIKVVQFNVSY